MNDDFVTTVEAATRLGVSRGRIAHFIMDGRLTAVKRGRDNWIRLEDIDKMERKPLGNHSGKPRTKKKG